MALVGDLWRRWGVTLRFLFLLSVSIGGGSGGILGVINLGSSWFVNFVNFVSVPLLILLRD
jgi:hypothetical protein